MHFGVGLHWRIVFFGLGCLCEVFLISVTDRNRSRYETNELPHHNSGSARHHCGLSKPV